MRGRATYMLRGGARSFKTFSAPARLSGVPDEHHDSGTGRNNNIGHQSYLSGEN